MRKFRKYFLAAFLGEISRDQNKVEAAFAAAKNIASREQNARTDHEREKPLDRFGRALVVHQAILTFALRPLICARFRREMIVFACSVATSTNRCRSRRS